MLQSHAVAREAHIRMKLQNRAAHCEVKSTNLTSKSRIQEKIAAVTEGPSNLFLPLSLVKFRCIKWAPINTTSIWNNSPVYFPAYNYLPQGPELEGPCALPAVHLALLEGFLFQVLVQSTPSSPCAILGQKIPQLSYTSRELSLILNLSLLSFIWWSRILLLEDKHEQQSSAYLLHIPWDFVNLNIWEVRQTQ